VTWGNCRRPSKSTLRLEQVPLLTLLNARLPSRRLTMTASPLAVARGCLQAYVAKDRAAIEALMGLRLTQTISSSLVELLSVPFPSNA
jgi:hypothetical protein